MKMSVTNMNYGTESSSLQTFPYAELENDEFSTVSSNISDVKSPFMELNLPYTICEVLVALVAVVGNAMVIYVFRKEKKLKRRTNYYIVSLATADFLVGLLGIPFAILASVGLPTNLYACLFTVSLLVVLCTISIFCLVAVSIDRYWAILYPMGYSKNVRTRTAIVIISVCWVAGSIVGFLPLFGWNAGEKEKCFFVEVMDYNYLVFLYFATIITPSLLLAIFYAHIYHVVIKQLRQIVTVNPTPDGRGFSLRAGGGTMLRVLGAAQKREVKATQNLSIIVLFFVICWIPLYTINCVQAFCPTCYVDTTLTYCCIILSHLNSAGNPILYAYHLRDFRAALKHLIYKIFGIRETPTVSAFDQHGGSSNFNHQRLQSLKDLRDLRERQRNIYAQSPLTRKFPMFPTTDIASNISTISQATSVAAKHEENGYEKHEMWRINEVSSHAEDGSKENSKADMSVGSAYNITKKISYKDERIHNNLTGKNNNGYVDEGLVLDFNDEDDDVFLSDSPHSTTAEIPHVSKKNFEHPKCNLDIINRNSSTQNEFNVIITSDNMCTETQRYENYYTSSSSPQLCKPLYCVESEGNSELSSISTTPVFKSKQHSNVKNKKTLSLSLSGDFLHSSTKNLKLSPFKVVGDFFVQRSGSNKRMKSNNKTEHIKEIDFHQTKASNLKYFDQTPNGSIKIDHCQSADS